MTALSEFVDALDLALRTHCKAGDYDLEPDESAGVVEVTTDDWTLSVETGHGVPLAFLSIDNEPDEEHEYARALHDTIRPAELRALREANRELEGALAGALDASGDPFSQYLGVALTR
jgi:hypothetical protein